MMSIPRWLTLGLICAFAAFTFLFGLVVLVTRSHPLWTALGIALFGAAFVVSVFSHRTGRRSWRRAASVTVIGLLIPVIGSVALDPATDSFSTGAWYVSGVVCIVVQLLLHHRLKLATLVLTGLVAQTLLWAGPTGLVRFGILATLLVIGVVAVSAWAIGVTGAEIERFSAAERQALTWRAAQDAYHSERQVRLANTALVAAPMLRRIIESDGPLAAADRMECRLLEQTIRDEIRGRRLLNRAVREQVMALRRRGAVVQVNDDGGVDEIDSAALDRLLNRVAEAITDLPSDRVIIRTAPADSDKALSVVAMSTDPIAVALGLDDGDDQVDLWLELDRPASL
jgi:hypothetical protein